MDAGHEETEAILKALEKRITEEYRQAEQEIQAKLDDYLKRFETKDKIWQKWVKDGAKTQRQYNDWRVGQIAIGKRWEEQKQVIAKDLNRANTIARSIVNDRMPKVYALNHNFGTYQVEKAALIDTKYTLYSADTVKFLLKNNPQLLPNPGKDITRNIQNGLDIRWNRQQVQSVMLQSILQGESIPQIATRLANTVGEKNRKAAIRNARTMTTYAENAGRLASYKRAEKMGIKGKKVWVATLDGRTRHAHRLLDGQKQPIDQPFESEYGEIMEPCDPGADPANVYNCRCCLDYEYEGFEKDYTDLSQRNNKLGGMGYKEWEEAKPVSNKISLPEEKRESVRQAYLAEYKNGFPVPKESSKIKVSQHAKDRVVDRGLDRTAIIDAIKNPLAKGELKVDAQGRPSIKYIGEEVTACYNPKSKTVTTAWKTGKRTRKKYGAE